MPRELERKFEKEYEKKGYTKKEADEIFYKYENKHKMHEKDHRHKLDK